MSNPSQTQKMEAVSNDIENELIKLTTNSNASKAESNSMHSSMLSKGGPALQASIKSEAPASIKSNDALRG